MKTYMTLFLFLILFTPLTTLAQDQPYTIIETTIHSGRFNSITFSPDGHTLVSIKGAYADLWDVSTGEHKFSLRESESSVYSSAFSPDGDTLAIGAGNGTLSLWDVATGERKTMFEGHTENVMRVLFSPDGQTLASMSKIKWQNGTIINLWDTESGKLRASVSRSDITLTQRLTFSPDSSTLAIARWWRVDLWDVSTGEFIKSLAGHTGIVYSTSFSSDGQTLASGSSDGTVLLWNIATGELKNTIEGWTDTDKIHRVMFSPDGNTLLINTEHNNARLWDINTGSYKANIKGKSGSFSPDSSILATVVGDTVYLWDVETARPKAVFDIYQNPSSYKRESEYENVLFSPDGNTLATYNDWNINLWNLQSINRVSITPYRIMSPANGQHFTINVSIENGHNIGGYQFSVIYDSKVLRYVGSANTDYLSTGAFPISPIEDHNKITLAATTVAGTSNGDGNLATITFEVLDIKATNLILADVILTDSVGNILPHLLFNTGLVIDPQLRREDVNSDGIVNIIDLVQVASRFNHITDIDKEDINGDGVVNIVDLVKVAAALGAGENAPSSHSQAIALLTLTAKDVQHWLTQAQTMNLTDPTSQRGIHYLSQLLAAFTPEETALLPNYPNPFNPETWIPYQLAEESEVTIIIYDTKGKVIKTLKLGTMPAGLYQNRSHAAYWDGTNTVGEPIASGIYFYTLKAGDYRATRKLLIQK